MPSDNPARAGATRSGRAETAAPTECRGCRRPARPAGMSQRPVNCDRCSCHESSRCGWATRRFQPPSPRSSRTRVCRREEEPPLPRGGTRTPFPTETPARPRRTRPDASWRGENRPVTVESRGPAMSASPSVPSTELLPSERARRTSTTSSSPSGPSSSAPARRRRLLVVIADEGARRRARLHHGASVCGGHAQSHRAPGARPAANRTSAARAARAGRRLLRRTALVDEGARARAGRGSRDRGGLGRAGRGALGARAQRLVASADPGEPPQTARVVVRTGRGSCSERRRSAPKPSARASPGCARAPE